MRALFAVEYGVRRTVYSASLPKARDPPMVTAPDDERPAAETEPEAPREPAVTEVTVNVVVDRADAVTGELLLIPAAVMLPLVRINEAVRSDTVTDALLEMPAAVTGPALVRPEAPTATPTADTTPVDVSERAVTEPAVDSEATVTPPEVVKPEAPSTAATALTEPEAVRC